MVAMVVRPRTTRTDDHWPNIQRNRWPDRTTSNMPNLARVALEAKIQGPDDIAAMFDLSNKPAPRNNGARPSTSGVR